MKVDEKTELYTRYVTTYFGKIHPDTRDFKDHYQYFRKNYLHRLPSDKNVKILDIGCGKGHFLNFLTLEGYNNFLGVDLSEENIEFCKKNMFNVACANIFPFLNNTSEIEHLEKPEILKIQKLILEKLRFGGRLIIKTPNASNPIMASSSRYYDFTHEVIFTEESLSQILSTSGFDQVTIYPQDLYVFYYNPLNYLAKFFNFILNGIFRILFRFYGRKTTKIFTKNLIAVAVKGK
jgi:SAM-dependent methyltransferase